MLLGNYSVLNKNPSRSSGGLAFSGTIAPWDSVYSLYTHEGYLDNLKYSALPTATEAPYSWILPPKTGGEMSSTTSIGGSGGLSGSLTRGGAISASMGGSGSFTSALGLLTALTATMAGTGSLTASISASLGLASTMGGTSTLAGSLGMLVPFSANLSGVGALSANLKGMASLSATIYVNSGSATIKEIVDGVWNAQTADYVEVGSMGEALPGGGGGGGGATAAQIWSYADRTLTESAGLTTEQAEQLTRIDERVDTPVSEIAVGWNPYIEGVNGLKKGIQKIVDKVEEKGEEVKTKVETEIKTIVIPEQKEPIVNVTTEKIDTSGFIAEIRKIKPEVTVNTEKVELDMTPVVTAINNIPQPVIPEQKEIDLSPLSTQITEIKTIIEDQNEKIEMIEDYLEEKKQKEKIEKEEEDKEKKEMEEEENLKKPFPSQFTASIK